MDREEGGPSPVRSSPYLLAQGYLKNPPGFDRGILRVPGRDCRNWGLTLGRYLWLDRGIEGPAKEATDMLITVALPVMMFVKCTVRKHRAKHPKK